MTNSNGSTFAPTHEIVTVVNGETTVTPVQECDGALYTREEWDADASADWERDEDGRILFQGGVPVCDEYWLRVYGTAAADADPSRDVELYADRLSAEPQLALPRACDLVEEILRSGRPAEHIRSSRLDDGTTVNLWHVIGDNGEVYPAIEHNGPTIWRETDEGAFADSLKGYGLGA